MNYFKELHFLTVVTSNGIPARALIKQFATFGCESDSNGVNITPLRPELAECSQIYWITELSILTSQNIITRNKSYLTLHSSGSPHLSHACSMVLCELEKGLICTFRTSRARYGLLLRTNWVKLDRAQLKLLKLLACKSQRKLVFFLIDRKKSKSSFMLIHFMSLWLCGSPLYR